MSAHGISMPRSVRCSRACFEDLREMQLMHIRSLLRICIRIVMHLVWKKNDIRQWRAVFGVLSISLKTDHDVALLVFEPNASNDWCIFDIHKDIYVIDKYSHSRWWHSDLIEMTHQMSFSKLMHQFFDADGSSSRFLHHLFYCISLFFFGYFRESAPDVGFHAIFVWRFFWLGLESNPFPL